MGGYSLPVKLGRPMHYEYFSCLSVLKDHFMKQAGKSAVAVIEDVMRLFEYASNDAHHNHAWL